MIKGVDWSGKQVAMGRVDCWGVLWLFGLVGEGCGFFFGLRAFIKPPEQDWMPYGWQHEDTVMSGGDRICIFLIF